MKHLLLFLFILSTGFTQTPKPFPQGIKTKLVQNDTQTLTIATGAVTANSGSLILAAETGTADDLDTINGLKVNQTIILRPDAGDTITLKHGTGNIITNDGADVTLNPDGAATGIYDGTNIRIASGGGGGGGGGDVSSSIGSSTDNAISVFDGAGGKTIKQPTTDINALTQKIINVVDPTADQHAATKKFVDDGFQPLDGVLTDLAGIALVQGDIVYYNGTNLVRLAPGTTGQFLKTLGAAANPIWDTAAGGGGATTALDNLAAVAINTSLLSDTDITDDFGSLSIRWKDIFAQGLGSGDTATDVLELFAWDVDGSAKKPFLTLTSGNDPTMSLSGDVTSATQTPSDNSLKLATTAYVDLAILAGGTTAQKEIGVALSNETSDLTVGVAKITFRMPIDMTLTGVRANVNTAPTGSSITVDINKTGVGSLLSTLLTIDATELTSETASVPAVISTSALSSDDEITIDLDIIGSTIAGKGLKIWLIGTTPSVGTNTIYTGTVIEEITIASNGDIPDFTSIAQTYDKLELEIIGQSNGSDAGLYIFFNTDLTATNYHNQDAGAFNGVASIAESADSKIGIIGGNTSAQMTTAKVTLFNYSSSTKIKMASTIIGTARTADEMDVCNMITQWKDTSSGINRIRLDNNTTLTGTGFLAGTVFRLIGYKVQNVGGGGSTDGWQNIGSEVTASGDALLEFDVSDTSYSSFRLIATDVVNATDSVNGQIRVFAGGAYLATNEYQWHRSQPSSANSSYSGASSNASSAFEFTETAGNATNECTFWILTLANPANTSLFKAMIVSGVSITPPGANAQHIDCKGFVKTALAITKFKFNFSSGNITSGKFQLQGFKPTP